MIDFLYYLYDSYDQDSAEFENAMKVFNYFKDSLEQVVLGDYTDKTTITGTGAQIILSIIPNGVAQAIDFIFDLRDLSENFLKNFNPESPEWWIDLTLDSIALVPEVGTAIKQLKQLDNLTGLKGLSKFMYNKLMGIICDENGKFIKNADEINEIVSNLIKDIDRLKANYKEINELVENKGAEEVFETYYKYGIDVLETLSKYKDYYDQIIKIIKDVTTITEVIEFINEYEVFGIKLLSNIVDNAHITLTDDMDKQVVSVIQAIYAEKSAVNMYKKYATYSSKTVASDTTINTLSGYTNITVGKKDFNRSVGLTQLFNQFDLIGHTVKSSGLDNNNPGSFYACHAEKQLSLLTNRPIGISRRMCEDCEEYFHKLSTCKEHEITIYTADPERIQIFYCDGEYYEIEFIDIEI